MFLVLHPVGNSVIRNLIKTMSNSDSLQSFHTSLAYDDGPFSQILPKFVTEQLNRRSFPEVPKDKIITYPLFDLARLAARKAKCSILVNNKTGLLRHDKLYRYIDTQVANYLKRNSCANLSAIYGYDGKCLSTFRQAKKIDGISLFYEAACGYAPYVAKVLEEERELNPSWISSIPLINKSMVERQEEELDLADHVIVASTIVKNDLIKHHIDKKISIIPYGAPLVPEPSCINDNECNAALKVVYVGSLSQQKGISYFFDAISKVGGNRNLDVTIIGNDYSLGNNKILHNHLRNYKWYNSAPHSKVINTLQESDILILPSLTEAFGLVVLEALSQGTVVIASDKCGASDVIINGKNGFIVPIRDSEIIADRLTALEQDRDKLREMKLLAVETARVYNWKKYSKNICNVLGIQQNDI